MNVLSRRDSFYQLVPPCLETIDPPFDGVLISSRRLNGKFAMPLVIADRLHRRRLQRPAAVPPPQDLARDLVVAIGEYVGFYDHRFSNSAFDCKSSAIDLGL